MSFFSSEFPSNNKKENIFFRTVKVGKVLFYNKCNVVQIAYNMCQYSNNLSVEKTFSGLEF